MSIPGYTEFLFQSGDMEHPVFRSATNGPAVLVMHELPGLTPQCVDLANRIFQAGFTVFMPLLFGAPNQAALVSNTLHVCLSREFKCMARNESSPITEWLRALSRKIHEENLGGGAVGAIGLCLTGGFVLSLMIDPHLMAAVTSEPALPLPALTFAAKSALGVDPGELDQAIAQGRPLLGLCFSGDLICPAERFATLQARFGDKFEGIVIDSSPGNPNGIRKRAHAVLTDDYDPTPGSPTQQAYHRVVTFLKTHLQA